jgi:NADPH-dependent glutamate synthase beta subunit-like oxidoreductase/formate hydrogenlyase subunit 6/NADH:ubiquinone oxidoreductase subunit I
MAVKERVLDLANKISNKKRGTKAEIKPTDPEYMILEPIVSEEMAEVAMSLAFRTPRSAEEVAPLCAKSVEETHALLMELADSGVCFVNVKEGVDEFWYDTWIPGIMEMMVNKYSNVEKYPQIGRAMEAYGRVRGPMTAGVFPVGTGLMRVIPIEKAIMGETRRASYEEISKYLEENEIFTVSNCSCRSTREIMGEGCGHLKEDMCIQMGHAAEYYIRTGRGRRITREEAYGIIARAEENGLMHQIPNIDGGGKTHAICNCCGCGCLSLRTAEMFSNTDMVRSNYLSRVQPEKCMACGECVEACPVGALKLGQKIRAKKPLPRLRAPDLPTNTEWTPERWNPDYRLNRKVALETGTSPCKAECPAHIGVQGYIRLASEGRYAEALELIKRENPFPAVCGRICSKLCEAGCTRGGLDEPVAVDDIKKFIADQDLRAEHRFVPKKRHEYGLKIAVVGSGPAGLACAYFLALDGYRVTVFEKEKRLGGMLTLGIPSFRLEKGVIDAEIDILRELGVEFKPGFEVGRDVTLKELRAQGYKGFYLAIGAQAGRSLGIEGEEGEGVLSGVDFMRHVNLGEKIPLPGKVLVIGGGNVAIDVARTAARVGSASVGLFCLESREEMPAAPEEIAAAEEEKVSIDNSWGPKRVILERGRVKAVEFKKCLSVFDENHRFSPKYDESVTRIVDADFVLSSIGQAIEWGALLEGSSVELKPNGGVVADPLTYQTAEGDVFVGGDVYTGPRFAIDAIAAGKEGAISLHRFVQKGQSLVLGRLRRDYPPLDQDNVDLGGFDKAPRQKAASLAAGAGRDSFRDDRGTFTPEQIRKEAARCLSCGAAAVDETMCVGCGMCATKCRFDAISLERKYDGEGVDYRDLKPIIIRSVLKRKLRIAGRKLTRPFRASLNR